MSETFDQPIGEDVAPDLDLPEAQPVGDTGLQPGDYVPDIQVHLPPALEDPPADHPLTPAEAGAAVGDDTTTPPPGIGPEAGLPFTPAPTTPAEAGAAVGDAVTAAPPGPQPVDGQLPEPPPPPPANPAEAGQSPVGMPLPNHPLTPAEAGAAVGDDTTTPPPAREPTDGELPAQPPLPTNLEPTEAGQSPIAGPIPEPGDIIVEDPTTEAPTEAPTDGPTDEPPTPDELPPDDTAVVPAAQVPLTSEDGAALLKAFGVDPASQSFVVVGAPTMQGVIDALGLPKAATPAASPAETLLGASPNHPVFVVDPGGPSSTGSVYHVERIAGPQVTLVPLASGLAAQTLPLDQVQAAAATAEDFSSGPSPLLVFGATAVGVSVIGLTSGFLYQRLRQP